MVATKNVSLLNNSRFYILCGAFLLSVFVFAWLRITIPSDQLFSIRTQQVYGLIGILFWYLALVISPIGYLIGKQRIKKLEFARRAIGVSAFYFVALHGAIALWGQLGGIGQLQYLPELFKWSLICGGFAVLILGIMAATSFNSVVRYMTPKRWKLLHRFVYLAGILAIVHIWSIGTHLAYGWVQLIAFIALVVLAGLEMYRFAGSLNTKYFHFPKAESITLFVTLWSVVVTLILAIPFLVENYHSAHETHSSQTKEHE